MAAEVIERTGIKRWRLLSEDSPVPKRDFGAGVYPRYLFSESDVEGYLTGQLASHPRLGSLEREIERLTAVNRDLRDELTDLQEAVDAMSDARILEAKAFSSFKQASERRERRLRRELGGQ